jgi:site-specific DNA-methyltransferase (adenine-specific)
VVSIDDVLAGRERWCVVQGDCLDVMRGLPDGCVDALIADPPYSSGGAFRSDRNAAPDAKYRGWSQNADGGSKKPTASYASFSGDNKDQRSYLMWSALWVGESHRASRVGAHAFIFSDWRQLPVTTDALQAGGFVWRGLLVWDKKVGRPMRGRFRNHLEYVVWGSNGPLADDQDTYPSTLISETPPNANEREHLTQKPVALFREMLSVLPPNSLILDPFTGSGSVGVAAVQLGHRFIGIERELSYCDIARRRIGDAAAQGNLFA